MLKVDNALYLISLILGGTGAWIINRWGYIFGLVDKPNDRSSHCSPTAKGGGIGILVAFIFTSLFLKIAFTFWVPAAFLALLSLWGDKFDLSPKIRLPLQFIVALILIIPLFIDNQFSIFWLLFYLVFLVATANWYNFMDGINGIAAITGIIGFSLLAAFNVLSGGDSRFSVLSICIALSCLGFLPFNIPKAKVFMGDVGSILLGFVFAAIVVMLSKTFLDFVCLAGFLFPFYADELTTMVIRIKDGENLLKAHRRHFYQILANEMGIDHWKVSVGYGILQFLVGVSILLVRPFGILTIIILLVIFFGGFVWANYFVRAKISRSF
jgi:Fuc2NAc and GlcNAc transferase